MASNGKSFALLLQIHWGQDKKPPRYYYLYMQSMDLAQSRVGDADRVGYFPIQTSRQTQTRHDGTDPADAL